MDTQKLYWLELNRSYLMTSVQMAMDELQFHFSEETADGSYHNLAEAEQLLQEIRSKIPMAPSLDVLVARFQLSEFEKNIILVCAAIELNLDYSRLISKIQGNPEAVFPTFNLLFSGFRSSHWDAISPSSPLRKWDLIHFTAQTLLANQPLRIDESILHYLTGFSYLEEPLASIVKEESEAYPISESQKKVADAIADEISANANFPKLIDLAGKGSTDKISVAKTASARLGFRLFYIDSLSIPSKSEDLVLVEKLWNRQALLNRYALFIDCSTATDETPYTNYGLHHFIKNVSELTFLDREKSTLSFILNTNSYEVANPTKEEQKALWMECLVEKEHYQYSIDKLVDHFNMSANLIHNAANEINRLAPSQNEQILWKTCCRHTRPVLENLAQRINTLATWDDIVLPSEDVKVLKEIVTQVRFRSKVYHEGGFAKKQSRGLGISALFSGESGTGKTMAAEVIANDLMLDLYRVDLSQVVNKYIGETEKNLKKIFDAAEEGGAILLFDEADSLFGKRSEVRDSHDRYSNLQVGYLLQRMESFSGLAILTTNMKNAIDKAFERRIRFCLHFERPDTHQRKHIWEKAFPNKNWVNGVDYNKLAAANVPGGNIKNIAMNAAFLAASEDSKIGMQHILKATKSEYKKVDRHLSNSEIKDWE